MSCCVLGHMAIPQIISTSSSLNISFMSGIFHQFVYGSIRSHASRSRIRAKVWIVYVFGVGSHLSPQILIFRLSPILQTNPSLSKNFTFQILHHTYEGLLLKEVSRKDPLGKYFSFRTFATSESGFCIIRHPCLASNVVLKHSKSQNPKPLTFFVFPIFSQLI